MNSSINAKVVAMNIIRYIGDRVSQTGRPLTDFSLTASQVDAPSHEIVVDLVAELEQNGIIRAKFFGLNAHGHFVDDVTLSLEGWEQYEAEKRGQFEGNYGFIAMEFGDDKLDEFVQKVVKPAILAHLGLELLDMRDAARAGIIDDIMRITIRDARFVVADLTHDNNGAYWEAGYAEGLGKPVIYICEKDKFDQKTSHFDVNHCTTVMWSANDPHTFCTELVAVLRRSLGL